MEINQLIKKNANQLLTHQLLSSWLKDYKRPNDKINDLVKQGVLTSIKKGLYISGKANDSLEPESILIANHIYGPSYVSMETALSYYGLIPERVYETTSCTIKPTKKFTTGIGVFNFSHLPLPYYSFGIKSILLEKTQQAMIASKEKALCDKLICTNGLIIRNKKQAYEWLFENLRMEESTLKEFDVEIIFEWLPNMPKKNSLLMIIETIKNL